MPTHSRTTAEERARHRARIYEKHPELKKRHEDYQDERVFTFELNQKIHEYLTPYALALYIAIPLLWLTFLFASAKGDRSGISVLPLQKPAEIEVAAANSVYEFQLKQLFSPGIAPVYSELEIEILDKNYDHVYSFYKDLWQERHPGESGGLKIYNDLEMTFQLEFPEKGTYMIKAISHNGNKGEIIGNYARVYLGNLYLLTFTIIISVFGGILLLLNKLVGTPWQMLETLKKGTDTKKRAVIFASVLGLILLAIITINLTNYGYPKPGQIPTPFFGSDQIIYLG